MTINISSKIPGNSQSSWCLDNDLLVKIGNDTTNVLEHTETLWAWGVKRHHDHDNCDLSQELNNLLIGTFHGEIGNV